MSEQTTEVSRDEQVEYRDIEGYSGYRVGNDGSVWSRRTNRAGGLGKVWRRLSETPRDNGRIYVKICRDSVVKRCFAHTLVLTAFVGPRPDGMQCCHNNGKPTDNRLSNLRWDTPKGNNADMLLHGTLRCGERHHNHKLTEAQVVEIRTQLRGGIHWKTIADRFGVSEATLSNIRTRRTWKYV